MQQTKNLSSADANAIIDQALLDAQSGAATPTPQSADSTLLLTVNPDQAEEEESEEGQKLSKEDQKLAKAQNDLLGKQAAEALRKAEAERQAREATLIGTAQRLLDKSKAHAANANDRIGDIPKPGSIAFPLVLLALFFFILVAFNGHTRLQWLWLVLTNNAHVVGTTSSGSGPSAVPAAPGGIDLSALAIPAFRPASSNGVYGGGPF